MHFSCAQTFFIDKAAVDNAEEVSISLIKLFFKSKPLPIGGVSGVNNPGVTVYIAETEMGVPNLGKVLSRRRIAYHEVQSSSDATVPTDIRFTTMARVKTDRDYAIIVAYDRAAEYVLWSSKVGDWLVGTTEVSPGPSGKNIGSYYTYAAVDPVEGLSDLDNARRMWLPSSDLDLKFTVSIARYRIDGEVVSNTNTTKEIYHTSAIGTTVTQTDNLFEVPMSRVELISFDLATSYKEPIVGAQMAYMDTVAYPGGIHGTKTALSLTTQAGNTIVVAESTLPNSATFSWYNIFNNSSNADKWVVIKDASKVNVRQVQTVLSNTAIQFTEPLTFSNSAATMLITPVGKLSAFSKASPFGLDESFLVLEQSSANATCRFVNNSISSIAVAAGGSGYSNSDVVYVHGFESVANKVVGGYSATANVRTNGSGVIQALYMANTGSGFINAAAITYTVGSSGSNTSGGTGASFTPTIGTTIKTELRPNNRFASANVCNIPISEILPHFELAIPAGSSADLTIETKYLRIEDDAVASGYRYQVDAAPVAYPLSMFSPSAIDRATGGVPVMISRSNEFVTPYANGSLQTDIDPRFSKNLNLNFTFESNNDFVTPAVVSKPRLTFTKYIINNDSTNESTSFGNAWAKGIGQKISFERTSEDVLVYVTAYRPEDTDVEIYARMHNSRDPDAFDDRPWTPLVNRSPNLRSSSVNKNDYVELLYGLPQYPSANNVLLTGVFNATNNSSTITGIGTLANTELAVDDLVRLYSPLFPDIGLIATVNSIANTTSLTLNTVITNNSFLSTTLVGEKITNKTHSFNYIINDNVARYYNSTMAEFDGYDSLQLKVVMLSSNPTKIPRPDDIRAVGVSA